MHRRWHHDQNDVRAHVRLRREFRAAACRTTRSCTASRSLLGRILGDAWQQFATLRAYYAAMWAHPGKKLLFMGQEFAQGREWNSDAGLDWPSLSASTGIAACRRSFATATARYAAERALHERDCEAEGFRWIVVDDADNPSSRGCASRGDGARTGGAPSRTSRRCRAPAIASACLQPAAGAKSSIPTARSTADRIAATRAASTRSPDSAGGLPLRGRCHAAAARNPLAGARRRRMISPF